MAKERICITCGKSYKYCPNCREFSTYPLWMTEYDTEECKEIFNIVSAYNMNLVKADDVKAVVKKYNITDFKKFKKSIADKLNEIYGKKSEEVKPIPVEEPKKEEEVTPVKEEPKKIFSKNNFVKDKFKNNNKEIANTEE